TASTDPQSKVKLKPVKDDAEAYRRLFHGDKEFKESSTVTANYRYFRRRLLDTELNADDVWLAIQRLEIMLLDLEKGADPQQIDETVNATGLGPSQDDKIRNFVLMGLNAAHHHNPHE